MATTDTRAIADAVHSLDPKAYTAAVDGDGVDVSDALGAVVVFNIGAWTDGSFDLQVEESDDDATYTAVADADLNGTEKTIDGAADDQTVEAYGYLGNKKFVRASLVSVTGTTTGCEFGATVVRELAHVSED